MRRGPATRRADQDPKGPRGRARPWTGRDPRADEFNELLERLADVLDAVGDPQRLRILVWVHANAGERFSPREVADGLGAALGTIAYHVRCLSLAGLIAPAGERRVRGARQHFYALTPKGEQVMASLADLFAARAERRRGRC